MRNTYSKTPLPVKPRMADLRKKYPLLWGFKNMLINTLPFALIWLASGWNMLVASLSAFFMMLLYCLRENHRNNKRLSEMARRVKEQGNDNAS